MSDTQSVDCETTCHSSTADDDPFENKDYHTAISIYSRVISEGHVDARLLLKRSRCHFQLEDYEKAFNDATAALDLDQSDVDVCVAGGRAASKLGRFHDSFRFYQRGLKLDKHSAVITEDLKQLQQLILKEQALHYQDAVEPTYSAVKFCSQDVYPGDGELLKLEKEILAKKYGISDSASLPKGVTSQSEEAGKHFELALRHKASGNTEACLEECDRAIRLDPVMFLFRQLRGSVYMEKGDNLNALADLCAIPKQMKTKDVWKYGGRVFCVVVFFFVFFFYLTTHSTHFIYGYMASDMVKEHSDSEKGKPLTARVLLYAPSYRQDSTYHGLCYTSRGALAGTRNSSMGSPHEGSIRRSIAP